MVEIWKKRKKHSLFECRIDEVTVYKQMLAEAFLASSDTPEWPFKLCPAKIILYQATNKSNKNGIIF